MGRTGGIAVWTVDSGSVCGNPRSTHRYSGMGRTGGLAVWTVGRVGADLPEFWQNPGGVVINVASGQSVGTVQPEFWQNPGGVGVDAVSG